MDRHRLLSILALLVASSCLAASGDAEASLSLGSGLLFAMVLVWFPGELGSLTGIGGVVNKTSPAVFVRFFGWLFLLAGVVASVAALVAPAR